MPLLRAPENRRTGIEINPKVRYPDQTEAAIGFTSSRDEDCFVSDRRHWRPSAAKAVCIQGAYGTTETRQAGSLQNQYPAKNTECSLNEAGLLPPDYGANPKAKHYMTRSAGGEHRIYCYRTRLLQFTRQL